MASAVSLKMVFFNYSTMQMAAKIVYYGPGLCGKTTNLQHIYGHTSKVSRGEMVSLETETDRTLFFDLLPLDVGSIQGFDTRIQLYTVPGQVFYNTTRKLVLKGVDGVVFVADSQRPMLQANLDSFKNLESNLAEIGLAADQLSLVLQYNKRDLPDVCSIAELDESLNRGGWPTFEASAISGQGVFETLKGISKLTLLSLKKRIAASQGAGARSTRSKSPDGQSSVARPPALASPQPGLSRTSDGSSNPANQSTTPAQAGKKLETGRKVDILGELEKIRRQTIVRERPRLEAEAEAGTEVAEPVQRNGLRSIDHEVRLSLPRESFLRARHFSIRLQVEDESHQVVDSFQDGIELEGLEGLDRLLVHLKIALQPQE